MSRHIEKRIREYFESKGLVAIADSLALGLPGPPASVFKDKEGTIAVFPISKEELMERNSLLGALLRCTLLLGRANKLYLAFPRAYSSSVDAELLREQGIGLLTFDEKRIVEVLPPKTFDDSRGPIAKGLPSPMNEDIAFLRERVSFLQRALSNAEGRINGLQQELKELRTNLQGASAPESPKKAMEHEVEAEQGRENEELPSFLVDNPWLEVLVQRGQQ